MANSQNSTAKALDVEHTNQSAVAQDVTDAPSAQIRPYNAATDLKVVRYLVGAQAMEPSSLANQEALYKPVILFVWAAMTWVAIVYFGRGWPTSLLRLLQLNPKHEVVPGGSHTLLQHVTEYLSILPMLAAPPIVLLALFEFRHRYMFEDEMARAIAEEDMRDIEGYYQGKAGSDEAGTRSDEPKGFWVLEYDGRIIGAMGLDGRKPGTQLDSLVDKIKGKTGQDEVQEQVNSSASSTAVVGSSTERVLRSRVITPGSPATNPGSAGQEAVLPSGTLHLRRFATSYTFRPSDIEDDLLEYVTNCAFASKNVQNLVITIRPAIERGLARRLAKNGWTELAKGDAREAVSARTRAQEAQRLRSGAGWKRAVAAVWPLNLEARTFVCDRATWERSRQ